MTRRTGSGRRIRTSDNLINSQAPCRLAIPEYWWVRRNSKPAFAGKSRVHRLLCFGPDNSGRDTRNRTGVLRLKAAAPATGGYPHKTKTGEPDGIRTRIGTDRQSVASPSATGPWPSRGDSNADPELRRLVPCPLSDGKNIWCACEDSNLDLSVRSRLPCPLDDRHKMAAGD